MNDPSAKKDTLKSFADSLNMIELVVLGSETESIVAKMLMEL